MLLKYGRCTVKFMRILATLFLVFLYIFFLRHIDIKEIWGVILHRHILIKIREIIFLLFIGASVLNLLLFIVYSSKIINVILFVGSTAILMLGILLIIITPIFIKISFAKETGFDWDDFSQIIFMLVIVMANLMIATLYKGYEPTLSDKE